LYVAFFKADRQFASGRYQDRLKMKEDIEESDYAFIEKSRNQRRWNLPD
jgi:hypothetical protein